MDLLCFNSTVDLKSGAHTAKRLTIPENIRLVFLPPYCPELNPIERVWRDLKDELAWEQFTDLASRQETVAELIRGYEAPAIRSRNQLHLSG